MGIIIGLAVCVLLLWCSICVVFHKGEKEGACDYNYVGLTETKEDKDEQK